ncbi:creatininase [Sulfuriferula thiophila]|uniref:creatininase n=1 Tax=Sulfuriferula thiophila TaxID=1781211 RepID=UPI000F609580|nr:creatininase [Sulfuriferula thiophila]
MNNVNMNTMSWVAYRDQIKTANPPVFLPVGALEQHGPHLPLGTDALLSAAVAASTAALINGIVAPALSYGYKSQPKCGGGQHFCGTTAVDAQTLIGLVRDTVREFARHGVEKLVVVNGHYENQWFITEGIDLAMRDLGPNTKLRVMRLEYWDFLTPATLHAVFPDGFPGYALEHAAVIETSLMLHYHPDLVRLDLIPDDGPADFPLYDIHPANPDWVPPSGVLSSALGADAAKGKIMASELAARIAKAVVNEFNGESR